MKLAMQCSDETPDQNPPANSAANPQKWLRIGAIIMVFCALIAVLITPLNGHGRFFVTLVHSECIGLSIFGFNRVFDALLFGDAKFRPLHLLGMLPAIPLGYVFGMAVAATALGEPDLASQLLHTSPFEIGLTIAASTCCIYFFWSRERLLAETRAHASAQRLAVEAQLKLLQTQIEPHMLFNTLSTLHTLIEVDAPRAQAMLDQLITYLRGTLSASRAEQISLQGEFMQLQAYLQLMSVRMGSRLSFRLELPEALLTARIPPMLLQPLVENAIKHGLEPKVEGGTVTIRASGAAGRLQLEICDTGLGLPPDEPAGGYGLLHVRERLRALYGTQAELKLDRRSPGLAVLITLPLSLP